MKVLAIVCRVLLGLLFVVFGLNGFLHFMPMGPMPPADSNAGKFMSSMMSSGWLPIISALELVGGILVLIGGTAPAGLVILGPIIFNALLFHILMAGGKNIAMAAFAAVLELALIYFYRANFAGILTARAQPTL